jgi:CheY-like chemotaxis protein
MDLVTQPQRMYAIANKRPLVLIVDSDARSASLLARLLRADGYDAEVTTDGAAALARLTRNPVPQAIVTDIHLAHADGFAIGRYARSRRREMPIFVVTGYPHAMSAEGDPFEQPLHFMTKPLDYPALLVRLVEALRTPTQP